ncbi:MULTISPECIES: helix-turn-helix domain-containing protein [unclassified Clostridioides]|uniref:helix-turn-helix domain-containing protein n=1 Tax=unclassified Clostridioides TaxID=2635829 RepID=UPI001D110626|nr:helix-turn-helix transcriptional regulator [Clostridioides sp. ES-S-0171-01]MCC0688996.1 helix-turn-helix transcriptional regulator [Clostridioides sp. ES-S-0056-01]MCC0715342.1 helix-turn-helix transcriptional regulator [Clostridioides sp. ES-S-0077-01]UDN55888.1 helix-turn-helix transcriptional regulator [Clostridioides sp. ES-S-0054-01]
MNLSREELSNKINISYSALSKYKTNNRFPDKVILNKIADFFDVSTDYLLGRNKKF